MYRVKRVRFISMAQDLVKFIEISTVFHQNKKWMSLRCRKYIFYPTYRLKNLLSIQGLEGRMSYTIRLSLTRSENVCMCVCVCVCLCVCNEILRLGFLGNHRGELDATTAK